MLHGHHPRAKESSRLDANVQSRARAYVIMGFSRNSRLGNPLPSELRESLMGYHVHPGRLSGARLPSGFVARILCGDDDRRGVCGKYNKKTPELEYFPLYGGYGDLVQDIVAFDERYITPRCIRGKRRRPMYRENDDDATKPTCPRKRGPVLNAKPLGIRRVLIMRNDAYYIAHIAADKDTHEYNSAMAKKDDYGAYYRCSGDTPSRPSSDECPESASSGDSVEVDGGLSAESGIDVPEKRYAAASPSFRFPTGAADVEAFFEEIRQGYPRITWRVYYIYVHN